MFNSNDEQYLIRALNRNQVVLFLGAGFSAQAKNQSGQLLPTGRQLGATLWTFLGYPDPFDPTTRLSEMYEAVLRSGKPRSQISDLLTKNLTCSEVPAEYFSLTRAYWHRIYTTNVDDLLKIVYSSVTEPRLEVIAHPNSDIPDRDVTLERIQAIHLNGLLPCSPDAITFSFSQYAQRASPHDYLYDHFVRDYATKTTIFVGTELDEPLFWQYIEQRKARTASTPENRPKSFLIAPRISPPKRAVLAAYNIEPIEGLAFDFLAWLDGHVSQLVSKVEILRRTIPGLIDLLSTAADDTRRQRDLRIFGTLFHSVPLDLPGLASDRSLFLLGATPRWEDILSNRDAPRNITQTLVDAISADLENPEYALRIHALLGSAGSGKSTVLRRLGITLARAGHSVFLTNSEEISAPQSLARAVDHLHRPIVLLFDNAETVLGGLPKFLKALQTIDIPPQVVIAARTNEFDRAAPRFPKEIGVTEVLVPHLTRPEIRDLIDVLDRNNRLGKLSGMSTDERIYQFESRANKQLLVALREATSGKGFDEILESEFAALVPEETKALYLCVALTTEAGYRLTIQEFVGCSKVESAVALSLLTRNLRDIVIRTGVEDDLLLLRHRQIAEFMVMRAAPRPLLREAYLRLLGVLASEIGGKNRRSRTFVLYRTLINHYTIHRRFAENLDDARLIFDSLHPQFSRNSQFLLQYGSFEMEAGNLDVAENLLDQADSLDPGNVYVANARGLLFLKRSLIAQHKTEAIYQRDRGSELLLQTIENPDIDDAYCYHIYCDQRLRWLRVWADDTTEKIAELEELRRMIQRGFRLYPKDKRILDVMAEVEKEYLSLAVR
jgi:tetratricopeptide (TPR) repeat protein